MRQKGKVQTREIETILEKKFIMYHWVRGKFSAVLKEDNDITWQKGREIVLCVALKGS